MCPEELVTFITTLAIVISKDRDTEEIDTLIIIFSQLASTLSTISFQRQKLNPDTDPTEQIIISN
jgi:hypothetical protein